MLAKPESCRGCPFYQTGQGFVPDDLRPGTRVMVLGQSPTEKEEVEGKPGLGPTSEMLEAKFFPLAGLNRSDLSLGHAIRCRLKGRNELPPLDEKVMREAVEHCTRAHLRVPEGTELVIAQGEKALYATTGRGLAKFDKISDWRGFVQPFRPLGAREILSGVYHPEPGRTSVLATYHLAAIFRDATLQHPAKYDWSRVAKVLAGTWPERLPKIEFKPPQIWPYRAAFDTEFVPETGQLIRYQLGWRDSAFDAPHVYVVEAADVPPLVHGHKDVTVIMHNTEADRQYLDRMIANYSIEDTMHAHAVLWSDFEHDLGFLGSIYGRTNRWKHLASTSPLIYAGADAIVTWDVWTALANEFERDPRSEWVYRNLQLPQVDIIAKARKFGLRVNQEAARQALEKLEARCDTAEAMAQAAVGWPMNLGSGPQVTKQLYDIEQVHSLARRRK